jgi:imidazolonepropionase-like amidohydrolase
MAEMGAFMVPTLITYEGLANEGERYGLPAVSIAKIDSVRSQGKEAIQILAKAGVKMGLGSDLLGETHYLQADELRLRAEILGNGPVLQQATLIGAEILGQQGQLGEVTAGAIADLLLVDGNPLTDITCLLNQGERIRAIAKDGVWVKNTL